MAIRLAKASLYLATSTTAAAGAAWEDEHLQRTWRDMNGSFHVVRGIRGMAKSKVWVLV